MRTRARFKAAMISLAGMVAFSGVLATSQPAQADTTCDWLNELLGNCSPTPAPTPTCDWLNELLGNCSATPPPPICEDRPKTGGDTWTCTFVDEFNGTTYDRTKWSAATTAATGLSQSNDCWVDSPNNIAVADGVLSLTSRREPAPFTCTKQGASFSTNYSSGSLMTTGKFAQAYGRFEIRAAMTASKKPGLHSALWMWREDQNGSGAEIDIAEFYTRYPDRLIPYIHYLPTNDPTVTNNYCLVDRPEDFHTYVTEWDTQGIKISYDGVVCIDHQFKASGQYVPPAPFDQPFFMILTQSLGVAGTTNAFDPATTELPATMKIDYVKAWK